MNTHVGATKGMGARGKAAALLPLIGLFALILTGCDGLSEKKSAAPVNVEEPRTELADKVPLWPDLITESNSCDLRNKSDLSPDEYERPSFERRAENGPFKYAMNMSCIVALFSEPELETWKSRGDPVAAMALIVKRDNVARVNCSNAEKLEKELNDIAAVKVSHPAFAKPISRVPEVFEALGSLRQNCGLKANADYDLQFNQQGMVYEDLAATELR